MMREVLKNLFTDESGQDMAEYGIALAVITIGAAALALLVGGNVNTLWSKAESVISSAAAN